MCSKFITHYCFIIATMQVTQHNKEKIVFKTPAWNIYYVQSQTSMPHVKQILMPRNNLTLMWDQQLWPWGCEGPARWGSHTLTRSGCKQRSCHWRDPQSKNSPWSSRSLFAAHLPKKKKKEKRKEKKEREAQECSFNPSKRLLAALPADAPLT